MYVLSHTPVCEYVVIFLTPTIAIYFFILVTKRYIPYSQHWPFIVGLFALKWTLEVLTCNGPSI